MKRLRALACRAALLGLVLAPPAAARGEDQRLVLAPAATQVTFTLAATLHTVEGRLPLVEGAIRFDTDTGAASGEITFDARRAETGNRLRDGNMRGAVLESERFPTIVFRPTRLAVVERSATAAEVMLTGVLEMHGVSREISVPAHVARNGPADPHVEVRARFPVRYVDWDMENVSTFVLRVADEVQIQVSAEADLGPTRTPDEPGP